jgi:ferredoxin
MSCSSKRVRCVRIVPGCISCGSCEAICPKVFEVTDIARVKPHGDLEENAELIREAADMCPVSVIKVDEE